MSPQIIEQSNRPVWRAIAAVRIDRNPATMCQLYDALNRRRNARAYTEPQWMKDGWADLRRLAYCDDLTLAEKVRHVATFKPARA